MLGSSMKEERGKLYHASDTSFAFLYETTQQPRSPDLISESRPISTLPNFTTPQLTINFHVTLYCFLHLPILSNFLISQHAHLPRAVHTSPNCTSIYIHYTAPSLLRLHAPTGKVAMTRAFLVHVGGDSDAIRDSIARELPSSQQSIISV
jgi:hypothetical protein